MVNRKKNLLDNDDDEQVKVATGSKSTAPAKDQPIVSASVVESFLSRFAPDSDQDSEKKKQEKRQRTQVLLDNLVTGTINMFIRPQMAKLAANNAELEKLHQLQQKDPNNPLYIKKEIELLKENTHLLGFLNTTKETMSSHGLLVPAILRELPKDIEGQKRNIQNRLEELGQPQTKASQSSSHETALKGKINNSVKELQQMQPEATKPPQWLKDNAKSKSLDNTDTVTLRKT